MKVAYIKGASTPQDYPFHSLPEVAFLGRSNAGKSSLINSLCKQKVAHISKTPGKTQILHFYNINNKICFVDLPGYGYAKRSHKEREKWKNLVEHYLSQRKNLKLLILVQDIRRSWTEDEQSLLHLSQFLKKNFILVLTKEDKLNQKEKIKQLKEFQKVLGKDLIYTVSNTKTSGIQTLFQDIQKLSQN
ncbi:MAG: YihA family ribosome biogenesis GTP-binding protein [Bdellovibrio sp.]|nr:MAG: YihA family ribosome biogenesis GTP-binding protein [Bdellovibrio sp.]